MKNALLDMAREASTAAEYSVVVSELNAAMKECRDRRTELELERDAALFGTGDLGKIRKALAAVDDELETLSAALGGATRRRDEHLAAEAQVLKLQVIQQTKAKAEEYGVAIGEFRTLMATARQLNAKVDRLNAEANQLNARLVDADQINLAAIRGKVEDMGMPLYTAGLSANGVRLDHILRDIGNNKPIQVAKSHPMGLLQPNPRAA